MANDRVVSKKTFGNHGLVIPGREPSLKTDGGLMYYSYDGMRNVTELTDRHGDSIEKYRYDAFGGLYTGVTAPYNTNGFAGKSYDAKANLIDMNARWYGAQNGRFTTADPYTGDILTPYTQNRYAYVGNNPINRWDPLGYWMAGDEDLSAKARLKIDEYEAEYYEATTDEGRTAAHTKADSVRAKDRDRWTKPSESIIREWDIDGKATSTQKKVSDGWQIYWRQPGTNYKEVKITDVLYTVYAGAISESTRYETRQTAYTNTWEQFKPFTAQEWYQENKALMKEYKIPISQARTLYEPKEAYSTKLKTTYGNTTTIPYLSERTGNNITKLKILEQDLYDSCGGGSNPNIPSVPVNNTGNFDIMSRISSIAGDSIMAYVGAAAIIAGAAAFTIATGGAGLPALIAATVAAGTMVSGAGLAVMGVNEIAYGATGKNVLLDSIFNGNTDLYSNTQLALTMGTVGGTQYSSAYSYQETVFRNGTEGMPSNAYRYVGEGEKAFIEKNGYIPNVDMNLKSKDIFVSPNEFTSISDAESALRIGIKNPFGATQSPLYRVDFNMNSVNYRYAGNVEGGTGIEMITEQRIPVNPNNIYPLGE
ncbi:MAG: RHS repeat-associated core domain-containing protein [Lutisporaceae bacterium]